jgi:SAM-dependent methyltransferase
MAAGSSELQRHLCPGNEWFYRQLARCSSSRVGQPRARPRLRAGTCRCCGATARRSSDRARFLGGDDRPGSRRDSGIRFEEGDAEALPFADGSFDTVVSNFGIHHVPDAVRALSEACRVLRPGGRIGFTSWAVPAANIAWKILFDAISAHGDLEAAKAPPSGGGLRTPEDFLRAMSAAGFAESRAGRGTALRFGSQSARRVWPRDRAHRGADRCPASPAIAGDRSRDRTSPRPLPASRRFCGADRRDPGFGRASLRAVRNRPSKRCVGRNNASHRACGKTAVYADRPVRRFIMTMDVGDPAETQQQADNEVPLEQVYGE